MEVGTKTTDASMDEWLQVSCLCFTRTLDFHAYKLFYCWLGKMWQDFWFWASFFFFPPPGGGGLVMVVNGTDFSRFTSI